MNSVKSIYKQKKYGQRIRVFDLVVDVRGRITGIHFKSGSKYDPPNLEGRSTNQTFLPLMLWLIWLPPSAGLLR